MMDITIEALKLRRRELEINVAMNQGALDEISHIIAEWERRRGGRPRKPAEACSERRAAVAIIPQRVEGGERQAETDEQLFHDGEVA